MKRPDMKKPELQDYGVTSEEYARYGQISESNSVNFGGGWLILLLVFLPIIVGIGVLFFTRDWDAAIAYGLISVAPFGVLCVIVRAFADKGNESRILQSPVTTQIEQYEEALATYSKAQLEAEQAQLEVARARRAAEQARLREVERSRMEAEQARQAVERERQAAERAERRKRIDYWRSLRGIPFEQELAALYRRLGYQVETTPKSGDLGVDLILTKDGKKTIVQCKGQKDRAAPAIVLQTIGARVNRRADNAVVACTGGFTHSAIDLAKRNRIELISAREMAKMAGSIVQSQQERLISEEATPASFPVAPSSRMGQQQKLLIKAAPASNEPTSPRCGNCGSEMTLRSTKYDKFWRCGRFPKCKGIRNTVQSGATPTPSAVENAQVGLRIEQPERAIPKQPAPKVILHRPLRREEASSNRSEQSQGNLSQDCQPVLNVLVAAALWHSWSYGKAAKASSGDVPGTQNAKAREILIGVTFVTRALSFDSGRIWIGPTSQG